MLQWVVSRCDFMDSARDRHWAVFWCSWDYCWSFAADLPPFLLFYCRSGCIVDRFLLIGWQDIFDAVSSLWLDCCCLLLILRVAINKLWRYRRRCHARHSLLYFLDQRTWMVLPKVFGLGLHKHCHCCIELRAKGIHWMSGCLPRSHHACWHYR